VALQQGRIVEARVSDLQGRNDKPRPVVIISETEDIKPGQLFTCVAITSSVPDPLPAEYVMLPFAQGGNCMTKLSKKSAAACHWIRQITDADVVFERGTVPPTHMERIKERVFLLPSS
jgi:mRNA-degrading endonuclease toxin of MazEF toxin-antitoxin module